MLTLSLEGRAALAFERTALAGRPSREVLDLTRFESALYEAIPEFGSGRWRMVSCRIEEVRPKQRKTIVFCRLRYSDLTAGELRSLQLVAKLYGSDRGRAAAAALRDLWTDGFAQGPHRVPRPYGYSPSGVLFQAAAPGIPWSGLLGGHDESALVAASRRAAEWLLALQGVTAAPRRGGLQDEIGRARAVADELGTRFPGSSARIDALTERLVRRLAADVTLVPSHGDLHPANVLVAADGTTVIDFDTFSLREAAFDVGYALGQLLIMSHFLTGDVAKGALAGLAFWARYQRDGSAAWPRVAAHVARTLLQSLHYELCVLRNARVELLARWTDLMEEWIDSEASRTLECLP